MAVTCTVGGVISGYCAIGRVQTAASPTTSSTMENTHDRMGRSMKKAANTFYPQKRINHRDIESTETAKTEKTEEEGTTDYTDSTDEEEIRRQHQRLCLSLLSLSVSSV